MCTVSYLPTKDGFFLTSSRDEKEVRHTLPPMEYISEGHFSLYYPKDEQAGGTWIAMSKKGRTVCLLNGAFENHQKKETYGKSRGLILLQSFNYTSIEAFCSDVKLEDVEPFTLLLLDYSVKDHLLFTEFRWDGEHKHCSEIDVQKPQIWSSATLYNPSVRRKREELFTQWILQHPNPLRMFDFHQRKHGLAASEDVLMEGTNGLKTVSISQVRVVGQDVEMEYHDLLNETVHLVNVNLIQE